MKTKSSTLNLYTFFNYAVFILFTLITLFPLFWMFNNSLKTNAEIFTNIFALPATPQFDNYTEAWNVGRLGKQFMNSVLYTVTSTFLILAFASMMSYAFAKMPYQKTSKLLFGILSLGILISLQAILVPLFIMVQSLGLQNSHIGIILVYSAVGLPVAVYLCTEYMRAIPNSLIESAQMDGASNLLVFLRIILPMTVPVLLTIAILNVLGVWNEFMLVLVLGNDTTNSIAVGVYSFASVTSQRYDKQMAALVIAVFPVILIYFSLRRRITQGVVAGALKG